ncbi:hypothetical protein BJ742DRAFT_777125 [Cladochytrium replicatum]|nr:hypothetical protein BJ742DRAFT_777125 [Cladochytrium replicatum]
MSNALLVICSRTADVYSNGVSEQILGDALKKYNIPRKHGVIATKAHGRISSNMKEIGWMPCAVDGPSVANQSSLSGMHLFQACEALLKCSAISTLA